ncbi:MAG: hypothetical protein ABRQ27_01045 [Clostridiaceae bacterium]
MGKRTDSYMDYKSVVNGIFIEKLKEIDLVNMINQVKDSLENRNEKHRYGVLWDNRPFLRISLDYNKVIDLYIPHPETIVSLKDASKEELGNIVFFRYKDSMFGTQYYNNTFDVIYNVPLKELVFEGPRGYFKASLKENGLLEKGCDDKDYILFILSTISDYYNV